MDLLVLGLDTYSWPSESEKKTMFSCPQYASRFNKNLVLKPKSAGISQYSPKSKMAPRARRWSS